MLNAFFLRKKANVTGMIGFISVSLNLITTIPKKLERAKMFCPLEWSEKGMPRLAFLSESLLLLNIYLCYLKRSH